MQTPSTCRCMRCYHDKPHLAVDEAAIERALVRAGYPKPRARLHILTLPPEPQGIQCNGTMTCPCEHCARERGRIQPHRIRQPWDALIRAA